MSTHSSVRGVAHDIRHLFCTIRLTAEVLERSSDEQTARRARRILRAVDRGTDVCTAFMDCNDTRSARNAIRPLLEEVVAHLPQIDGVTIGVDCPPGLTADVSSTAVFRCLFNLASNALDAVATGGGSEVCLRARKLDKRLILTVEDDGPGFGQAAMVRRANPHAPKSAGLGMGIIEGLVGEMGGKLRRLDGVRGGTSFRLVLPQGKSFARPRDHPTRLAA